ncbi:hypothetical protein A2866_06220 [Candidatus Roizmanbacteria bacterium RIFCSPHIGHO2_01_FULL_39_8]|uniref:Uncharacterized protein n=1 Tax=Candidatus Roizmanbacteria bacterium RIFCSPHIGHO2_01_FULL_39_8 TaxID=1802033 RepID=A0A1F7GT09_9BACT|nr:MAG: hypothetical protein A2866_06220 [Candidatus Roizmanbacteria bacterium RIFCSPHIGHO2_01_FULL_39_8]
MNEPVETSTLPKTLIPAKNMQVENKIPPTSPETPHRKSKGIDPKVALASAFTLLGACSSLGLAATNQSIQQEIALSGANALVEHSGSMNPLISAAAMTINWASSLKYNLDTSENVDVKENPHYRPLIAQVEGALSEYEKNGRKATYIKSKDFRNEEYYKKAVKDILADPKIKAGEEDVSTLGIRADIAISKLFDAMPKQALDAFGFSNDRQNFFITLVIPLSGTFQRAYEAAEVPLDYRETKPNDKIINAKLSKEIEKDILLTKRFVEEEVQKNNGKPVSAAKILEYFLEKNAGRLDQSLWDVTIFLKFMARSYQGDGKYFGSDLSVATKWTADHILDEFSKVLPYDNLTDNPANKDLDLINRTGSAYHSYNFAALLNILPSFVLKIGGATRGVFYMSAQGPIKVATDLDQLTSLDQINTLASSRMQK